MLVKCFRRSFLLEDSFPGHLKCFEVSFQTHDGVLECQRAIFFDKKVTDPSKAVSGNQGGRDEPRLDKNDCKNQEDRRQIGADKMQAAIQRALVFLQIARPKHFKILVDLVRMDFCVRLKL